jgi:hypothetical protein
MVSIGSAYEALYKTMLPAAPGDGHLGPRPSSRRTLGAELYTRVRVPVATGFGPAFTAAPVREPMTEAIRAYAALDGRWPGRTTCWPPMPPWPMRCRDMQRLAAEANARRAAFDTEEARELAIGIPRSAPSSTARPAAPAPKRKPEPPKPAEVPVLALGSRGNGTMAAPARRAGNPPRRRLGSACP